MHEYCESSRTKVSKASLQSTLRLKQTVYAAPAVISIARRNYKRRHLPSRYTRAPLRERNRNFLATPNVKSAVLHSSFQSIRHSLPPDTLTCTYYRKDKSNSNSGSQRVWNSINLKHRSGRDFSLQATRSGTIERLIKSDSFRFFKRILFEFIFIHESRM